MTNKCLLDGALSSNGLLLTTGTTFTNNTTGGYVRRKRTTTKRMQTARLVIPAAETTRNGVVYANPCLPSHFSVFTRVVRRGKSDTLREGVIVKKSCFVLVCRKDRTQCEYHIQRRAAARKTATRNYSYVLPSGFLHCRIDAELERVVRQGAARWAIPTARVAVSNSELTQAVGTLEHRRPGYVWGPCEQAPTMACIWQVPPDTAGVVEEGEEANIFWTQHFGRRRV